MGENGTPTAVCNCNQSLLVTAHMCRADVAILTETMQATPAADGTSGTLWAWDRRWPARVITPLRSRPDTLLTVAGGLGQCIAA